MNQPVDAVVLGGSLAGALAASALATHMKRVTIIERDDLPAGPELRTGVPQARHTHLLMAGGARAIDALLPGTTDRLIEAGAHRIRFPTDVVSLTRAGWLERFPSVQYALSCSRMLIDWVIRDALLSDSRIEFRPQTEALDLLGSPGRITGVVLRDRSTGMVGELAAGLVVDATGRGSRVAHWLAELGLPPVSEEIVDAGQAYASRIFRSPPGTASGFPMVNVMAVPGSGSPGHSATLLPIEDGRWIVTLGGTRGGEPPTDEAGFLEFARVVVRHPIVADAIAAAEPLGPIYGSRSTVNRRRHFDRLRDWPAGFVVLGDAAVTFNPVYGHGMSVAAKGALALRAGLAARDEAGAGARQIQRKIGCAADEAWQIATRQDVLYPGAVGRRQGRLERLQRRYFNRAIKTATRQPAVSGALAEALTLTQPFTVLAKPSIALRVLRGPQVPPLGAPPLEPGEAAVLGGVSPPDPRSRAPLNTDR